MTDKGFKIDMWIFEVVKNLNKIMFMNVTSIENLEMH